MGLPILTMPPIAKGNWRVFLEGLLSGVVTHVKIPKTAYGVVSAHPGGAPSAITAPSGNIKYDDMTMQMIMAEGLPDILYLWYRSILDPLTGLGLPAVLAYRPIIIVGSNNSNIPQKTWYAQIWPSEREWDELEGGSDDPMKVTMTFKVNSMYEIGL